MGTVKNALTKVFILLVGLSSANAQLTDDTPFRFGIHFSPNVSYISTDDEDLETSALVRFGFGLMAHYAFADNYAISTGITVVNRGGELTSFEPSETPEQYDGTYKAGYIEVPIMLKMNTREFGYFTYFAEFGGSIDIEINENVEYVPELPDKDSYVRPLNLVFTIGGGTEYSLGGKTSLVAGIYYNRSLNDNINDDDGDIPGIDEDNSFRFDFVSLKLGVLF